jgi:hypothetical protein
MQIEIKPFKVKRWHVAALGLGTFIYGTYLAGVPQAGFIVTGLLVTFGTAINWFHEHV